jgi:hypothetical protein
MSSSDIVIFQILAGLCTLCFLVLTFMAWRFLRGMEEARGRLLSVAINLEKRLDPILEDLRAGSAQFRVVGERARRGSDRLVELSDQFGQLTSFGKTGVRGIWALLTQTASAFLNK